ncbi:MAG: hypothetical protein FJ275_04330, partial [Planctomycetes bacterium]|nr:hypothetical protein [Planctomycetota bacterium]
MLRRPIQFPSAAAVRGIDFRPRCAPALAVVAALVCGGVAPAQQQPTAQMLIGKAVSDDDSSDEVNNAIGRFMASDIDGCKAI